MRSTRARENEQARHFGSALTCWKIVNFAKKPRLGIYRNIEHRGVTGIASIASTIALFL